MIIVRGYQGDPDNLRKVLRRNFFEIEAVNNCSVCRLLEKLQSDSRMRSGSFIVGLECGKSCLRAKFGILFLSKRVYSGVEKFLRPFYFLSESMGSTLSLVGIFWALVSLIAPAVACLGFFFPFWIHGKLLGENETTFGSFIRCGFPRMTASGDMEITQDCGRYSSFWAIPSPWWKATTVLAGTGSTLSLLVGLTATFSCCISDILTSGLARFAGFLQLLSGCLIAIGVGLYPIGWGNEEVLDACDAQSGPYQLGRCTVGWSMFLMGGGIVLLFLCFLLSFKACRVKKGTFRI